MRTSVDMKKILVDEIRFVATKMAESPSVAEKLYYFSGIFGVMQRLFNIKYDEELLYVYTIVRATHDAFIQRMNAGQHGDPTVPLTIDQIDKLCSITQELLEVTENGESIEKVLRKFVILSYSTNGNGYYLLQKGLLKI